MLANTLNTALLWGELNTGPVHLGGPATMLKQAKTDLPQLYQKVKDLWTKCSVWGMGDWGSDSGSMLGGWFVYPRRLVLQGYYVPRVCRSIESYVPSVGKTYRAVEIHWRKPIYFIFRILHFIYTRNFAKIASWIASISIAIDFDIVSSSFCKASYTSRLLKNRLKVHSHRQQNWFILSPPSRNWTKIKGPIIGYDCSGI